MSYILKTAIANKANYGSQRSTNSIKYIVYHYTANDGDHDESNGKYFQNNIVKASAHYFVDDDSVTQSVPDNFVAWSVGGSKYANCAQTGGGKFYGVCTNSNSISIEMCDTVKDGKYNATPQTQKNAIELGVMLMKKYNIDINHVIRHFDVTGKNCPAYFVDANKWQTFKNELLKAYNGTVSTPAPVPNVSISNGPVNDNVVDQYRKIGQIHGNNFCAGNVFSNGLRDASTKKLGVKVLQHAMNLDYKSGLTEDGVWGAKSEAALGKHYVKLNETQYMCSACAILLLLRGYQITFSANPMKFNEEMQTAIKNFQKYCGLSVTGICDANTFKKLIG